MRIARYAADGHIYYGTVELAADGGPHPDTVADLTGDPLAGPVNLTGRRHALAEVRLLAPVIPRSKIVGLARDHAGGPAAPLEAGATPAVFFKPNTSVIGPDEPIAVPALSRDTAVEGGLAVVIGRICRHLNAERVPEVVFGYTAANDVTARDFLADGQPWGIAKGFDSFTPLGPWLITHLSLEEAGNLEITTTLDEAVVQHGSTKQLLWPIARQIAYLSRVMTLLPGDVILTGAGAPAGSCRVEAGQRSEVAIEEIGRLGNPVIAEAD
ncbi:MAG: fumarylacetoacetate hydrolase family protein [Propionibacteriaceae bacterium]|jgi:2-keto-4-pentenoate hydratase/2-oxohepta-3-ene-1,7-dioic acid hydratase in catechol pathway|nr:fumarylacetoacetate hydrolase family protein [Propionibacteriaceae bacterium]